TWKNQRFETDQRGNFRLKNVIANKKLESLANIMREYNKYLEKEGLYDFSDMIEEAIKTLKNDAGFRLTLSERFQYILLDEFQDTNTSQAELIYLLTDYEKPNIMAVGDDDQAIFAFQGANASNLIEFQQHYDSKVITLTENYRSIP
ncbi:UvrD-helicase domain-containing protein, partial [Candidatus Saccharibacteria bacterium]|nr:UvrD-helicase domain-containing protein [Candidatus Saccharibacteria bacterium]